MIEPKSSLPVTLIRFRWTITILSRRGYDRRPLQQLARSHRCCQIGGKAMTPRTMTTEKEVEIREFRNRFHTDALLIELDAERAESQKLKEACAAAYQFCGAGGANQELLDNLLACASGDPLPHDEWP